MNQPGMHSVIGVDIGGTNMRYAVVSHEGKILVQERQATDIAAGWGSFFERLCAGIEALVVEASVRGAAVAAVGIGVPGLVGTDGTISSSVNLRPLEGMNLAAEVTAALGLPAAVANDANAFAYGEGLFGAARGMRSYLMLTLGTGVGGGLVLDGNLWTGIDGAAGEYGHGTVEPSGRLCSCGNTGCLEQYASASAIAAEGRRAAAASTGILAGSPQEAVTARIVAEAARRGDAAALAIFAEAGRYLGIAAATAANFLNLEGLIIGGGVAESFDLLEPPIVAELERRAFAVPARRMRVLKGILGDDGGILGSAAVALKTCHRRES